MLTALNCFALCTNFTLLQEDPIHTRSSRVRIGGLGSAHCRKISSLKRHVPFDALYIIHKVKAVTIPFRARSPYLEENAERSISRPNSDNLCRTPAIAISIIAAHAHRLYSSSASISTFATLGSAYASAQTPFGEMRLLSTGLRHFVSVVSRLLRFTVDAPNSGAYRMSRDTTCRRLVSVNWRRSWRRVSD